MMKKIIDALRGALDALEYIDRTYPNLTGYGVRAQRMEELRQAIDKAEANQCLVPVGTVFSSSDGPTLADCTAKHTKGNTANAEAADDAARQGGNTQPESTASRAMLPVTDSEQPMPEARLTAMVTWLEANQPDVFRRGLWDAITGATPVEQSQGASPVAGWVSVEDERKPAEHEVVAVIGPAYGSFDKGRYVSSATYYNGEFFTEDGDQMHPPSHWQHLPPAPVTPTQQEQS